MAGIQRFLYNGNSVCTVPDFRGENYTGGFYESASGNWLNAGALALTENVPIECTFFAATNTRKQYAVDLGFPSVFSLEELDGTEWTLSNGNKIKFSGGEVYAVINGTDTFWFALGTNSSAITTIPSVMSGSFDDLQDRYNTIYFAKVLPTGIQSNFTSHSTSGGPYYKTIADNLFNGVEPFVPPPADTDPYSNLPLGGEDEITGGGSGTVSIPGFPGLSATSTGIIGLFAPSASQMQALASFMWTDFGGQGTTTEAILSEIVEALKRSISNPLDYVVGLNIIPSQGLSIGAAQTIQFGFVSSNVSMPALSSQYFTVDCGSITFDPLCGDTFLDYAPYSKFSIYLPYIGVKDLDANDCVGHTIGVVYHGDTVTGGVTAYITKDQSVMYQYSGCCALNVPLSSDNWGSTIAGAVKIATSMVSGGLTAGAAGVGAAAAKGAANVAANPSLLSPQVQHSGAVSGGAGCMGVQYPFIIREAVRFHSTAGFNKIAGYPSFYKRKLSNVSGYTTVVDVHLDNVPATKPEIDEIIELLKGGVYL